MNKTLKAFVLSIIVAAGTLTTVKLVNANILHNLGVVTGSNVVSGKVLNLPDRHKWMKSKLGVKMRVMSIRH